MKKVITFLTALLIVSTMALVSAQQNSHKKNNNDATVSKSIVVRMAQMVSLTEEQKTKLVDIFEESLEGQKEHRQRLEADIESIIGKDKYSQYINAERQLNLEHIKEMQKANKSVTPKTN